MRYILDSNGYVEAIAFGSAIICNNNSCTEYVGTIPDDYSSLSEWAENANIRAYKIVDGNLVYDSVRDSELQAQWETEEKVETSTMGKILWTNPNPTNSFNAQNITLSSDDYDILKWFFKTATSDIEVLMVECLKGSRPKLAQYYCGTDGIIARDRNVLRNSDTSYWLDMGRYCANGNTGRVQDDSLIIPLYVIGYKSNLFN